MDLTPSEKVEIAKRIEGAMEGRRGRPKKDEEKNPPTLEELKSPKERESATIAAKAVDMKPETYRKAKDTPGYVVGVGVYIRVKVLYVCPRGFLLT